ncbi:MAG TPA: hypothetical protein DDY13_13175 [Cytophagales bacterium]|nr:hypothetical protein [Cytophagales bacterium]
MATENIDEIGKISAKKCILIISGLANVSQIEKTMKTLSTIILIGLLTSSSFGQIRTIHVFVALCDNEHQGIVPVPNTLGNGKDPNSNLYWGAAQTYNNYQKCGIKGARNLFTTGF